MFSLHRLLLAGLVGAVAAGGAAAMTNSVTVKESTLLQAAARPPAAFNIPDILHSDDLIGANIRNGRDETIGEIDGLLVNRNGGTVGVIVEVGGFLGVGAKQIVVPLDQLVIANGKVMIPTATKQEIESTRPFVKSRPPVIR